MTLRLWLVRHGPTHEQAPVGWRDVPADLSDTDVINALRTALPADAPIVSSDLSRAVKTADVLASGPRLADLEALREINFGAWDGIPFAKLTGAEATLSRQFWDQPGDIAPPGGESWNQVYARVNNAVETLCARHNGDLIVAAHFGVIVAIIQKAMGISPKAAFSLSVAPLSLSRVDFLGPNAWRVERVNQQF